MLDLEKSSTSRIGAKLLNVVGYEKLQREIQQPAAT
jgi:hypothetical protein